MKIVSMNDVSREPFPNPIFTGPDVTRQLLVPDSKEFSVNMINFGKGCLLYTSPSPRDRQRSRMPSSA